MKRFPLIIIGMIFAVLIAGFGLILYQRNQAFWELHFTRISESESAVEIMLDGEIHGKFLFDQALDSERTVIVIPKQNVHLPFGEIRFADLTSPPGRVIIEINDEVLDIMRRRIERRSAEWVNPPYY